MSNKFEKEYFYGEGSHYRKGLILDRNRLIEERKRMLILKNFVPKDKDINILELGCAKGFFLKLCDKEGWETYGVDISSYVLEEAKKYTKAKLYKINMNKESLSFPNNFFDTIVSFDLIEHLEDDNLLLKETKRTLKNDGIFLISTPDGKSKYEHDETHVNIYKKEDLIIRLKNYGFKILNYFEYHAYIKRIFPFRRFVIINFLNQKFCDFLGLYAKEVIVVCKKF